MAAGSLTASTLDTQTQFAGSKHTVNNGVIKISDTSKDGGALIITSKTIPLKAASEINFSVQAKCENVTTRTQVYIHIYDQSGKRLNVVGSSVITGTSDWQELKLVIPAGALPATAAGIKVQLQPAAGPAAGTGTAWFRDLKLDITDPATLPQTQRLKWNGMKYTLDQGVITLTDDSTAGGSYLLSNPIKVKAGTAWIFSCEASTVNNTGRAQMHVFVFDKSGKRLQVYSSNSLPGTSDWKKLSLIIDRMPAASDSIMIVLQPSAGPASGTGTAQFRNLEYGEKEVAATLPGIESINGYITKYNALELVDKNLKKTPFATPLPQPRLELMYQTPEVADVLQIVTPAQLDCVKIAPWQEGKEEYAPLRNAKLQKVSGGYAIDLKELGPWRKLAVEFPGKSNLTIETLKLYKPEYPEENWQANWIWFTPDRIENIVVYLRGEFELDQLPKLAMMQGAVDDGGEVYVNGHRVASIFGRATPPNTSIAQYLRPGKNTICAIVHQARYSAGLLVEMDMVFADGSSRKFITDKNWRASTTKPAANWMSPEFDYKSFTRCVELGRPPHGAWGAVKYRMNAPKTVIQVLQSDIPSEITAGESYNCKMQFQLPAQRPATPVRLNLMRNGITFETFNIGITPADKTNFEFGFTLDTSKFLMPGDYELVFSMSGCKPMAGNRDLSRQPVKVSNSRRAQTPDARLKKINGVPTLTVNGKPYFSIFSAHGVKDLDVHARIFHKSGLELYHVYHTPDLSENQICNFAQLDMIAATLLKNDPNALMIVKLSMRDGTPQWMRQKHPEDMVVFDNGARSSHMSLASSVRREYYAYYIRQMIKHVEKSPYADRVIGYFANEGEEGQWMHYWSGGNPSEPGTLSDYSQPMLDFFRQYLRRTYKTNAALQAAWNDPNVTFDNAAIPSREMRTAYGNGVFRDPSLHRSAIDYAYALSECVTEGIEFYGKVIKEATGGKALTGALYGHLIDLGSHFLGEQTGYIRQKRAIETPYIDYYLGPLQYASIFRDQGGVGSYDMPSPATLVLYNKLWVNENDARSHLQYPAEYAYSIRTAYAHDQVIAREVGKALCSRAGFYYFPLSTSSLNFYDDPESVKTIGELDKITKAAVKRDLRSTSDIAVFMSDESHAMLRQQGGGFGDERLQSYAIFQREAIGRIGSPFDEYLQFDAAHPQLKDYKLYIFLNPYLMTDEEVKAVQKIASDKNNHIIFVSAPGIANGAKLNMDLANRLTGMDFELRNTRQKAQFKTTRAFESLPAGHRFGHADQEFSPVPVARSFDEVLACFEDGTPAVVRKGNIFFTPAALLPPEILRHIANGVGIDIQSRNNIAVYSCASYTAFHSSKVQGTFSFAAPRGKLMRQLWPVDPQAKWVESVQWQNKAPESRIYELKNK